MASWLRGTNAPSYKECARPGSRRWFGLLSRRANLIDIDCNGLTNAGLWFIGRIQAQRNKERVPHSFRGAITTIGVMAKEWTLKRRAVCRINTSQARPTAVGSTRIKPGFAFKGNVTDRIKDSTTQKKHTQSCRGSVILCAR